LTYFPQLEDLVGIDDLGVIRDRNFGFVDRNFDFVDRLDFAGGLHGVRWLRNQSRIYVVGWVHQTRIEGKVMNHGVVVVEVYV
jgi:hypothetical protein